MRKHEISDGQGELLTPDLSVPDDIRTVVPSDEFERRRDEQMATPGSVALQEALEDDAKDRELDHAVDTRGISYAIARRSLGLKGHGRTDFHRVTEEIRTRADKGEYKKQLPPPQEWRGSAS